MSVVQLASKFIADRIASWLVLAKDYYCITASGEVEFEPKSYLHLTLAAESAQNIYLFISGRWRNHNNAD